ncbi:YwhD family protein [Amphibacillus sp. MSJ-3]|uniref:YwhD family protein n=1 Tax=Amphibacillus sp. MSJ-3 TaxID=2841505 RepID=UPI001C0F1D25|nr:YwhD family protein [Amphibacillus sp. MSJ-3]MBU5594835.1 YwhD family protein [Amphibacillus sp. MSJ-3]
MTKGKQTQPFTIIKDDSTDGHGGFGVGAISLENVSPIIIDPNEERAFIDMGAMHGRSEIERRVKFVADKDQVPNGLLYWIAWITVEVGENGPYYYGVTSSEMRIDRPNRIAYKSMPEHVMHLDKSLKGHVIVEHMDAPSRQLLGHFLREYNAQMWTNSLEELKQAF